VVLTSDHRAKRKNGRRAPDEVKELVVRAAHRLFSEQGYHATTTRQIAEDAGVGESVLFRNFGSKAELFEMTILGPFIDFINEWANNWNVSVVGVSDPEPVARAFVKGFYELAAEHRELFHTLIGARVNGADPTLARVAARVNANLGESMQVVQRVLLEHSAARHFRDIDAPVTVAVSVGSILSMVLFDEWLFPPHKRRPGKARQIDEATRMLLYGVTGT
jgi:AcrR family transcriptional regulator